MFPTGSSFAICLPIPESSRAQPTNLPPDYWVIGCGSQSVLTQRESRRQGTSSPSISAACRAFQGQGYLFGSRRPMHQTGKGLERQSTAHFLHGPLAVVGEIPHFLEQAGLASDRERARIVHARQRLSRVQIFRIDYHLGRNRCRVWSRAITRATPDRAQPGNLGKADWRDASGFLPTTRTVRPGVSAPSVAVAQGIAQLPQCAHPGSPWYSSYSRDRIASV
jgi:hypothetical protein